MGVLCPHMHKCLKFLGCTTGKLKTECSEETIQSESPWSQSRGRKGVRDGKDLSPRRAGFVKRIDLSCRSGIKFIAAGGAESARAGPNTSSPVGRWTM